MAVPEDSRQFFPFFPLDEQEGRRCARMRQLGASEAQLFEHRPDPDHEILLKYAGPLRILALRRHCDQAREFSLEGSGRDKVLGTADRRFTGHVDNGSSCRYHALRMRLTIGLSVMANRWPDDIKQRNTCPS